MMDQTSQYIIKLKAVGKSNAFIAEKLGWSLEELAQKWKDIEKESDRLVKSGMSRLADIFTLLCRDYNQVGEGLKQVALMLQGEITEEELRKVVSPDVEKTLESLRNYVILRPPPPPAPPPAAFSASGN